MTKDEIEAIRERSEAATAGPWSIAKSYYGCYSVYAEGKQDDPHAVACSHISIETDDAGRLVAIQQGAIRSRADAEFIAEARTDITKLCDASKPTVDMNHLWDELTKYNGETGGTTLITRKDLIEALLAVGLEVTE